LEEHSVLGGLGAAVTEITSEHQPTRVLRIGVPDRFSVHCGTHAYLLREHGLDTDSVRTRIDTWCAAASRVTSTPAP
jgi:transketolase